MTVFVALLLTVAAFAAIVYPFFRRQAGFVDTDQDTETQELRSRRDTTYSMLKELEFDYQSGLLTEEDYQDLQKRYRRKGITLLKNLDRLETGAGPEDELENQIQRLRRRPEKAVDPDDELEKQISRLRRSGDRQTAAEDDTEALITRTRQPVGTARFCPGCGEKTRAGDRFCPHCGTRLEREENGA